MMCVEKEQPIVPYSECAKFSHTKTEPRNIGHNLCSQADIPDSRKDGPAMKNRFMKAGKDGENKIGHMKNKIGEEAL